MGEGSLFVQRGMLVLKSAQIAACWFYNAVKVTANFPLILYMVSSDHTTTGTMGSATRQVLRIQANTDPDSENPQGRTNSEMDRLAVEEPLEIRLSWFNQAGIAQEQSVSITMRTPGQDEELALGFLISEGLLTAPEQLANAAHDDTFSTSGESQNTVLVSLQPGQTPDLERLRRHFYTTSSCGVCGKASLDAVRLTLSSTPLSNGPFLRADQISVLPNLLFEAQGTFHETGGLHAAGLFSLANQAPVLKILREDVGRHNAVDKVVGWAFSKGLLPLHDHVLMLSGRASFELIQKAIAAGIPMVAAVGAPSTLAVDLASAHGLTLLGFVRDGRFNVYSGKERLQEMI